MLSLTFIALFPAIFASVAQSVARVLGKDEVTGSIPVGSFGANAKPRPEMGRGFINEVLLKSLALGLGLIALGFIFTMQAQYLNLGPLVHQKKLQTSIEYTIRFKDAENVEKLLKKGVNPDGDDPENPLIIQAAWRSKIVKLLLEYGADPNAARHGKTALMHAARIYDGDTGIARMLLEYGADVNARDDSGRTALDYAYDNKRGGLESVLREAGGLRGWEIELEAMLSPSLLPPR